MPDRLSIQDIELEVLDAPGNDVDNIVIPAHTLYGDYPAKIPEPEIMPVAETGEIVLNRVVIPEYVIVHDGAPSDSTAANYYVRYKDYIKNVASSEIYATWPDATIRANVLAIMSFTLNRIYTEFYRGKGYNFNITSSTAYDHKFIYGRNIYDNISLIVNEMFENYLSRPNVKQPILTQYCDGQKVSCPSWMTQWGSKSLGDQGYSAIEILRYFYGSNMYINTAEAVSGIPASWPGYNIGIGSSGQNVYQIQKQLARIAKAYPANPSAGIPSILGVISVVQITLDAISSAATQSPTTIFLIAAEITLIRSSEECKSILTTDCPSKCSLRISVTKPGISTPLFTERYTIRACF